MEKPLLLTLTLLLTLALSGNAQIESLKKTCETHFSTGYISDGQDYYAALRPDQPIEFRTTFFGNNTYRIATCSSIKRGDIVFKVYDTDKNLLFSNEEYGYPPYWDFTFTSTVTCIIQVDVRVKKFKPGYIMLLIGYKQ